MKIGIINFHCSNNYGAVLQCLALQDYLTIRGHDCYVIDYEPRYIIQQQIPFGNPFFFATWAKKEYSESNFFLKIYKMFLRTGHCIYNYRYAITRKRRNSHFRSFCKANLKMTSIYTNNAAIESNPPIFDVYVSGSDQIWNPKVTYSRLDSVYFLNFAPNNKKKIAYAVSPCQLEISLYKDELSYYLNKYTAISLREKDKLNELQKITHNNIETMIDPTLLLEKTNYSKYEDNSIKLPKSYVLIYGFSTKENPWLLSDIASDFAEQDKLPIFNISIEPILVRKGIKNYPSLGPGQFLTFVKNADFIVTNSFHGTAFSIIYEKNFVSVEKKITASRMGELMTQLNLSDRLINCYDDKLLDNIKKTPINYSKIRKIISEYKKKSDFFFKSEGI